MSESSTFRMQPRKSYLCFFLLTICVFLTQGLLAAATDTPYGENELHKDNELHTLFKRPAFFVGSRYGRSSGNAATGTGPVSNNGGVGTSKTRRLIIVPRNDRFFLGSRYGKRSDEYLSPYEQSSLGLGMNKASVQDADRSIDMAENTEQDNAGARIYTMSCVFTGISNFYRCNNVHTKDLNNMISQNDGLVLDNNNKITSIDTDSN